MGSRGESSTSEPTILRAWSSMAFKGRTGNVLQAVACSSGEEAFRAEFVTGEDQDFFRRKIARGPRLRLVQRGRCV